MVAHPEHRLLVLVLCACGSFVGAMARAVSWNDPQLTADQSQILRNSINDQFWHDSIESPAHDKYIIYPLLFTSKLQKLLEDPSWQESPENGKRWLNNHFKQNSVNRKNDLTETESDVNRQNLQLKLEKRNGYMCHFKLCQLGASSGKRRWSPSAFD